MDVFIYNSRKYKQIYSDRKQISGCLEMGREMVLLQEWAPFQGLKGCSYLTLGIELSKETGVVRTQETSLARGAWAESRRVREPRRTTVSCGTQPLVLW